MVRGDRFSIRRTGFVSLGILIFLQCVLEASCTKCLRDENYGDLPQNIYYCEESDKPECCTEGAQFTCCEATSKKTLKDQLILWGAVVGVGLLIAGACVYFWKDGCGKEGESKCCCCCRRTVKPEDTANLNPIPKPGTSSFTPAPWAGGARGSFSASDRDSPAPAFNYKPPTYDKY